jgi:hypothetical protein
MAKKSKNSSGLASEYFSTVMPRTGASQGFHNIFHTAAGSPNGPRILEGYTGVVTSYATDNTGRIEKDIFDFFEKHPDGVLLVGAFNLTNPRILQAAAGGNCLAFTQKFIPYVPTMDLYVKLRCSYTRDKLPGKIWPHLVRRDAQEDYGLCDGLRLVGNLYETVYKQQNEKRPFAHPKFIIGIVPAEKKGVWKGVFAWHGSMNFSLNAETSFEFMSRSVDSKYILNLAETFAFYWSCGEPLYGFSQGAVPEYTWKDAPAKFLPVPDCTSCGSARTLHPAWVRTKNRREFPHHVLRCAACGAVVQTHVLPNRPYVQ